MKTMSVLRVQLDPAHTVERGRANNLFLCGQAYPNEYGEMSFCPIYNVELLLSYPTVSYQTSTSFVAFSTVR